MNAESPYRVFISYSHQDAELVGRIASILEDNGLRPMLKPHGFFVCNKDRKTDKRA